ncbi:MAG: NADH-quinone oxidoreductase subunit NuoK [Clostridia bacterium]|nr:NADH-quinone oxidoreductase subunit NuoK [Clostridia bacterium]MCL6522130.1 NADH-quinone oxidoreductase subunit NuoK [Bacillota bacterium]
MIPLGDYLVFGALLFSIGLFGALRRENAITILMSIELMLNAVNVNLVAFSRYLPGAALSGQIFAIFIITVAAAEAAVGLAVILVIARRRRTVDINEVRTLHD